MGISSYYFKNLEGRIIHNNYWDAHITSDNEGRCLDYATNKKDASNKEIVTNNLVLWLDVNNTGTTTNGESLTSLVTWDEAIIKPCSGFTTCDFGLTGVDNGRYDRLSGITVSFTTADTKVILYPVTGYTVNDATSVGTKGKYDYPWTYITNTTTKQNSGTYCTEKDDSGKTCSVGDVICLDGGFYQGFFKLDFENPNPIEVTATTFECDKEVVVNEYVEVDVDATKYDLIPTNFNISNNDCSTGTGGWSMETWVKWDNSSCSGLTNNSLNDNFSGNTGFLFYIGTRAENKFRNVFSGETGLYTCDGIIPLSPDGEEPVISNEGQDWFSLSNYNFIDWGCCNPCTGSTVTATTATTYCDELSENALGIRIKPDGRIGYRKMTVAGYEYWCDDNGNEIDGCLLDKDGNITGSTDGSNCSYSSNGNKSFFITGTTMEEGYSKYPVVLSGDNWTHIAVTYSQNSVKNNLPAGTLKFWVNGRMVYRVDDFIGLQLRALNEYSSKQLGVPYNISWGGGSQGLLESQTFGGPDPKDQNLDIAKYFAGTFDGELSQLRFYKKPLNLMEIRNNLYVDSNRYCVRETFGGSLIVQPALVTYGGVCVDGELITSDTLGISVDLKAIIGPGSINVEYIAELNKTLSEDFTYNFDCRFGVVSGSPITATNCEITIPKGSISGTTSIVIDDDYSRITDEYLVTRAQHISLAKLKVVREDFITYLVPPQPRTIVGCTDSEATNYNPLATIDDGSCNYVVIQGCTDPEANNYNPNATVDNGTCNYDPEPPTVNNTIYYGKLIESAFNETLLSSLTIKNSLHAVSTYIGIEEGPGYGFILIPQEMQQPSLFRNSNEGCVGFAIPMIDMGEITLTEGGEETIYKIYRTYVSTYADIDVWLCD